MVRSRKRIRFELSEERITRRSGLVLCNELGRQMDLGKLIDEAFGPPLSNHGKKASEYVEALVEMIIDGAMHLEEIRYFENDTAYKELTGKTSYPSPDAMGDWLRRHGGREGETRLWEVIRRVLTFNTDQDLLLDIDATIIQAEKGDATRAYEGTIGYQPLVGIIAQNALAVGSEFRYGHESPQDHLDDFVECCQNNAGGRIKRVRSDSAGYNHFLIGYCFENKLEFTITADQDSAVLQEVAKITHWQKGRHADGQQAPWEVSETVHALNKCPHAFRLVVKRYPLKNQLNLFSPYGYYIVATNIPEATMTANEIILHHNQRGEMERLLGEIKHHFNLDHVPCGQWEANALYFAIGLLAYNIVQILKQVALGEAYMKKSIRTLRYQLLHLASKVIHHARYLIVKITAATKETAQILADARDRILHLVPV